MHDIEGSLKQFPIVSLSTGDILLEQGTKTNSLYFLLEGEVSVVKDGFEVAHRSSKGSVYGEMSLMLDNAPSATVKCVADSSFYCVENPLKYLESNPDVIWHIVKILSKRLSNLNEYLVDVKKQYEDKEPVREAQESKDAQRVVDEKRSAGRDKMLNEILTILQVQ